MLTVGELAAAIGAEAVGDLSVSVSGVAEPTSAGPGDLAIAMAPRYAEGLQSGKARAALLWPGADWQALGLEAALYSRRPRHAMAGVSQQFDRPPEVADGVHPSAVVDPSAELGPGVVVGPLAVIGPRAQIGSGTRILSHVSIGEGAVIGEDALIHAGVRIGARVRVGSRLIAQPGAVLGGDGFSFVSPEAGQIEEARATFELSDSDSKAGSGFERIHSLGSVRIGDDVEVGANSCIDRGTISDTSVGSGTKIDNLVQVGHNVRIGTNCLLCGHVGIGGSTVVGDNVVLAGRAAVADNLTIGSNVIITGNSGVASNVPSNRVMMGYPAVPMDKNVEMYKALRRLPRLLERLRGG